MKSRGFQLESYIHNLLVEAISATRPLEWYIRAYFRRKSSSEIEARSYITVIGGADAL